MSLFPEVTVSHMSSGNLRITPLPPLPPLRVVIICAVYRHYKGKRYAKLWHSAAQDLVVCRALDGSDDTWCWPTHSFNEKTRFLRTLEHTAVTLTNGTVVTHTATGKKYVIMREGELREMM